MVESGQAVITFCMRNRETGHMKTSTIIILGMMTALGGMQADAANSPATDVRDSKPMPAKTAILDQKAILDSYARGDNAWYVANVPFFDCPDKDLRDIYYYRWWNLRQNIHWDARSKGWTIHEGGGYGIVPCAGPPHLRGPLAQGSGLSQR